MKIAFYHPNMHWMGGGETVCLTLASYLSNTHEVTVFVSKPVDVAKYETFFGLSLDAITFVPFGRCLQKVPFFHSFKPSLLLRLIFPRFKSFDLVIDTCSNGLFHKRLPCKTFCYVHFPNFTSPKRGWKSLGNRFLIKKEDMFQYDHIFCNSEFTKSQVATLTDASLDVVYPPVKIDCITPLAKKPIITSIGRFSPEKKFEPLIEAFIKLEQALPHYTLHLIGAYNEASDKEYYDLLVSLAKGHNVVFHKNMPHSDVLNFLSSSKFYWHARGFGETNPVEYENFGITTVEAMSAGCIPLVINLGAQPEIVQDADYIWSTVDELVRKTLALDSSKQVHSFIPASKKYSSKNFIKAILRNM